MKLIRLLTVSNLFALETVQSCQHCQLCVLRENSIIWSFILEIYFDYINSDNNKKVKHEDYERIENWIEFEEFAQATRQMSNNKSPGP